jgi:TatD DNase family protein
MPKIFDTHCHISKRDLSSSSYISQNAQNFFLNVTTKKSEWLPAIDFTKNNPNLLISLGLHPWYVKDSWTKDIKVLSTLLELNKISAIGEIGLDYSPKFEINKEIQLIALKAQISLAEKHQLPISLHCIKAFDDLYMLLKNKHLMGVLHGFSGSVELAQQFIKLGLKIGIGGLLLKVESKKLEMTVKNIELKDIVIETDYPNFTQQREALSLAKIDAIIVQIASIKKLPINEVNQMLYNNALNTFSRTENGY